MSFTSREIMQHTLDFTGPERVARTFAPSDVIQVDPQLIEGEWQSMNGSGWQRIDAWGNVWGRVDDSSKGEVIKGALTDLADVETFQLPDFADPALYAQARRSFAATPDQWHTGFIHGFAFSMARKLRRLDQYFMDLALDPARVAILHDRIDAAIRAQIDGMKEAGADAILFAEDWGTQRELFISPDAWRTEFKPRFADLCAYAHARELKVFMHSCGQIGAILPDLCEAGVDCFQFDQPLLHGLDALAKLREEYRVTFWCPVDVQQTLPTKDEGHIRLAARDLLDWLWRGEGGFIAGWYSDPVSLGITPADQALASDEFLRHGRSVFYGL